MHFKNTNTKSAQYEKFHDAYKKNNIIILKKKTRQRQGEEAPAVLSSWQTEQSTYCFKATLSEIVAFDDQATNYEHDEK